MIDNSLSFDNSFPDINVDIDPSSDFYNIDKDFEISYSDLDEDLDSVDFDQFLQD